MVHLLSVPFLTIFFAMFPFRHSSAISKSNLNMLLVISLCLVVGPVPYRLPHLAASLRGGRLRCTNSLFQSTISPETSTSSLCSLNLSAAYSFVACLWYPYATRTCCHPTSYPINRGLMFSWENHKDSSEGFPFLQLCAIPINCWLWLTFTIEWNYLHFHLIWSLLNLFRTVNHLKNSLCDLHSRLNKRVT